MARRVKQYSPKPVDYRGRSVQRRNLPDVVRTRVSGVTFTGNYPENMDALALKIAKAELLDRPLTILAELRRNPENEYDENAIEVHVPDLGAYSMIGHIPARVAAKMAPEIDNGTEWKARIVSVAYLPGSDQNPGLDVLAERQKETIDE